MKINISNISITVVILAILSFIGYFNYEYQKEVNYLNSNPISRGLITDVLCDSKEKCVAMVVWYDSKEKELVPLVKGEKYGIADNYVKEVKYSTLQRMALVPKVVPNLRKYEKVNKLVGSVSPINWIVILCLIFIGLSYLGSLRIGKSKY